MKPAVDPDARRHTLEQLSQPESYRFGPENLLLTELLASQPPAEHVLDLGCGCGVLGLLAAHAVRARCLTLVDLQPHMLEHAAVNQRLATCPVQLLHEDIRSFTPATPADLVVLNPPFFPPGAGRESSNPVAARATHAHHGDVADFIQAAARCLHPDGAAWLVYPADGLAHALHAAAAVNLAPDRIAVVHARHRDRPFRVWVRMSRNPDPMQIISCSTWTRR